MPVSLANLAPAGGLHPVTPKSSSEMVFTWVAAMAVQAALDRAAEKHDQECRDLLVHSAGRAVAAQYRCRCQS
jgi:hypothetical protein